MTIKWHEERIHRTYFGNDGEGNVIDPAQVPLTSKWINRATGIWVHAWGLGDFTSLTESGDVAFEIIPMCWEGIESNPAWNNPESINRDFFAPGFGSVTIGLSDQVVSTGRINKISKFYNLPDMGAAYPSLTVLFTPVAEDDGAVISKPIWAAAKILYRVEH